jgi:pyruvate/2-oxoglutarate dehydrogenase complex dihydrolipoamide dehydrogenase (E3) component
VEVSKSKKILTRRD